MKKILGILGVVLSALLVSYYGMGVLTEHAIKKNIQAASQFGSSVVEVTQYKRSLFHSSAVIQIRFREQVISTQSTDKTPQNNDIVSLNVPTEIYHGPVIFSGGKIRFGYGYAFGKLSLPKVLLEKLASQFTAEPVVPSLDLHIMVSYLGQSTLNIEIPTFKFTEKNNQGLFEWKGFNGDIAVSRDMESVSGKMHLKGLTLLQKAFSVKLEGFDSQYQIHKDKVGIYVGNAAVLIPSLLVTQETQTIFDLSRFHLATDSAISQGLFHSSANASFTKLVLNRNTYGESALEASLKNLDATVVASLNEQAKKLKYAQGIERQKILFSMFPELPQLLSKNPVIEISKLAIAMPEGVLRGSAKLALPASPSMNPFQLLQKIEGRGQLELPIKVLKRVLSESLKEKEAEDSARQRLEEAKPKQGAKEALKNEPQVHSDEQLQAEAAHELDALVQANLLVQRGNDYAIEFELANGTLKINGHVFDPSKFQL